MSGTRRNPCWCRTGLEEKKRKTSEGRKAYAVTLPCLTPMPGHLALLQSYLVGVSREFSPHSVPPSLQLKELHGKQSIFLMSTGQATSSTDNVRLIIDALADYAKETGIDLSKNPFAAKFEQSRSPDAILQRLEEREKAFKEYRDGKRRLINCLKPAVTVLHKFSRILSGAAGLVSRTYHLVSL